MRVAPAKRPEYPHRNLAAYPRSMLGVLQAGEAYDAAKGKAGEYKDWAANKAGDAYDYAKGQTLPPATVWQRTRSWATGKPLQQVQVPDEHSATHRNQSILSMHMLLHSQMKQQPLHESVTQTSVLGHSAVGVYAVCEWAFNRGTQPMLGAERLCIAALLCSVGGLPRVLI